ncbi:uncharacterized protein PV09_00607 [Verruconis gallopava]|uniref:SWIRM domain-containing protein n=1 Tax=Verruconis gallopava TaxID=253628 RepID=A0A0D1Z6R2_9PEZI|nr:uncharacterized protein PV09_00607 [Verruconis gallopava]KIW08652.1 hypothetical protein PV09_00607 [Verruconis gallopava]
MSEGATGDDAVSQTAGTPLTGADDGATNAPDDAGDVAMGDDAEDTPGVSIKQSSRGGSAAPASDNPLDAPAAPVHETEDADGAEDTEMAGTDHKDGNAPNAKSSIESAARANLIAQTHVIILPSYSTWFDMNEIHSIERKSLPEWFNGRNRSKTPQTYKECRDFMINTYRLNPTEYLTFTACRRNLCGDVCAIMRVHQFLETWGLINYQVDPETRPSTIGPPSTGHFRITADTPRGLQPFQPAPYSVKSGEGKPLAATDRAASAAPLSKKDLIHEGARNVYEQNGKEATPAESKEANGDANGSASTAKLEDRLKEPPVRHFCHVCSSDCTAIRYHHSRVGAAPTGAPKAGKPENTDLDICPNCFLENKFPENLKRSDFQPVEGNPFPVIADKEAPWTETEELLLLEGLEMFDDDWNKISDHVGSRTREECVLKFLQLEIEDKYLEPDPVPNPVVEGVKQNGMLGYLAGGRVPFSQADNPVLSTMSYLVGLADPATTAAAAGKAVEEVRRIMRARLEKAGASSADKGKEKEGGETVKAEGTTDMDVDAASPQATDDNAVSVRDKDAKGNPMTTLPFALSAARAAGLASHEERTLTRLVHTATNLQMEKLELKLRQFNELEAMLAAERRDLERRRQQLFLDRLQFQRRVMEIEEVFSRACSLSSPQEGMKMVKEALGAGSDPLVVKKVGGDGGEVMPVEGKSFEI